MEILDPDLWNDDGTPKRPTKQYMDSLEVIQAHGEGLMRIADNTSEVAVSEKKVVDQGFMNYARVKREAKAARSPEVGDIVHWYDERGACRAAIVMETESFTDNAELRVHIPNEPYVDAYADHDEGKSDNTWHWPCGEGR